ncbi:MAG: phosphatidylserine decarboxylase [Chloroflexi bacterium]|nr:phosphatidylserine decarboxylase [Chloroflexota bacterium]
MSYRPTCRASDPPALGTAREGLPYVLGLALAAAPLWRWRRLAGLAALALAGGIAAFFRDPVRRLEADPALLYAPADGTIIGVDRVDEPWYVGHPSHRISIFLSLLDVHVNRSPVEGTVEAVRELGTGFAPAMHFERSHGNRRREVGLMTERGRVLVVQVAGLLARRIVGWVGEGERVAAGQKLGMITFGSRTDLVVPLDAATPLVVTGQHVVGGETPLARWR